MSYPVRLHGDDTGCPSCGHPEGCPCSCCTPERRTALCPTCTSDLIDEGLTMWCPHCQRPVTFGEVIRPGDEND